MKTQKARRFRGRNVLLTAAVVLLLLVIVAASTAVYAYFSTRVYVYTDDGNRQVAKLGMRLNLLFDRIIPYDESHQTHTGEVANGTSLGIVQSIDAQGNVTYYTYDSEAEWGSAQNPYIISDVRHLHNLSALQSIGYFADTYIKYNYEDEDMSGTYLETAVMPYFLVCNPDGTPATVDCEGFTISPIGTDEYPFIGYVGGAFAEGTTTVNGLTSDTSAIYDLNVTASEDRSDVGLFGTIGYLGTEPDEGSDDTTFKGAVSIVRNLLLFDVRVKVEDHTWLEKLAHRFAHDANDDTVSHENHHIGILAGHAEYTTLEYINVYYSSDSIAAIDLSHTTTGSTSGTVPNYLSTSGILGYIYNMNPNLQIDESGCYSVTASSGKSSEYVHAIGAGNEWGGSIDMYKMYNYLQDRYTASDFVQYPTAETVTIAVDGTRTTEVTAWGSNETYRTLEWDADATASFTFAARDDARQYTYLYGVANFSATNAKTVTTITLTDENAVLISDGSGHYLNLSNGAITDGDSAETATRWRLGDGATKTIYTQESDTVYYLRSNNNALALTSTQGSATAWTFNNNTISYNSRYLLYDEDRWVLSDSTYYVIHDNNGHYLNATTSAVTTGTEASEATKWAFSAPNGSGVIYTRIGDNYYYLRNNGGTLTVYNNGTSVSTTANTTGRTSWTSDANTISSGDYSLYLNGSNNWALFLNGNVIGDGNGNYLTLPASPANGSPLANTTNPADAVIWTFNNPSGTGVVYTQVGSTYYYLRNNNGTLIVYSSATLSTTTGTERTAWTVNNDGSITSQTMFALAFDNDSNTWKLHKRGLVIGDGSGNYLGLNGTTVTNATSPADAAVWTFANSNGTGTISTVISGTTYYLRNNSGTLQVSNNNSTNWTCSGNYIYNGTYYLCIDTGLNWGLYNTASDGYVIGDGNGNYLALNNGSLTNVTGVSNATVWTMSGNTSVIGAPSGNYNYYYYLRNNGGTLTTYNSNSTTFNSSTNTTSWTVDYENGTISNNNYYLDLSGTTWTLKSSNGYLIGDGSGNYLALSGTSLTNVTSAASATVWTFSNGSSGGYISAKSGTSTYYLRQNNGTLSTTTNTNNRTSWTVSNGRIYNGSYYLSYGGEKWMLTTVPVTTRYLIHDGNGHYLSGTGNGTPANATVDSAAMWLQDDDGKLSLANNTTRYLCWYKNGNTNYYLYIYTTNRINAYYTYQNGYLAATKNGTTYYVRYNNGWTSTTNQAQATPITMTEVTPDVDLTVATPELPTLTIVNKSTLIDRDLTKTNADTLFNVDYLLTRNDKATLVGINKTVVHPQQNYNCALTQTASTFYNWRTTTSVQNNVTSNYSTEATIFPLAVGEDGKVEKNKNTGYVIGGTDYNVSGKMQGDIRVSRYAMENISVALGGNSTYNPAKLEIITRTASSNGYALIKDDGKYNYQNSTGSGYSNITAVTSGRRNTANYYGLNNYAPARDQLEDVLNPDGTASSYIYGLHFMNITSGTSIGDSTHRVEAPSVWINGKNYTDYVMPTNCIDFNLAQKGRIGFFAGSYFPDNSTFFSLYLIVRDNAGNLQHVYEIDKIYGIQGNELAPVYYKLVGMDGYTKDGKDGSFVDTLPSGYPNTPLFEMDWVTMSNGNTIVKNAVYYFEIPVNEGEYALGSVTGDKTGAYLMYLDIGASETAISYRDGAAGSALGTIDYVYDNNGKVITISTVPDELPLVEDYQYYYASLFLMMTDNDYQAEAEDPFPNINQCRLYVRRRIATVDNATKPVMYVTVQCGNDKYIRTTAYSTLADPIARTNSAYSP